jgi:hypothetical protein
MISPLIGSIVFLSLSFVLPSRYKVHFVLTIDAKFFQNPLIGDFFPSIGGVSEMKAQGDSLLRQALTPEFLDSLGDKYGLYLLKNPHASPSLVQRWRTRLKTLLVRYRLYQLPNENYALLAERQTLLSHIDIFSLSGTTYQVDFIDSNPDITFRVVQDIHAQMIQVLLEMRKRNLVNFHDAIQRQLASLTNTFQPSSSPAPTPVASSPQLIREQLGQIRGQIAALSTQYTDEHPVMQELRNKETLLANRLDDSLRNGRGESTAGLGKPVIQGDANREVFSDLNKKLNYLNIAIDSDQERQGDYFSTPEVPLYPTAPLFPKKPLFAFGGFAFGLFLALFSVAIREYFDRSALRTETLAHHLKIPLVGNLPAFPQKLAGHPTLIGAPSKNQAGHP